MLDAASPFVVDGGAIFLCLELDLTEGKFEDIFIMRSLLIDRIIENIGTINPDYSQRFLAEKRIC